jgi:hypothetical protein
VLHLDDPDGLKALKCTVYGNRFQGQQSPGLSPNPLSIALNACVTACTKIYDQNGALHIVLIYTVLGNDWPPDIHPRDSELIEVAAQPANDKHERKYIHGHPSTRSFVQRYPKTSASDT